MATNGKLKEGLYNKIKNTDSNLFKILEKWDPKIIENNNTKEVAPLCSTQFPTPTYCIIFSVEQMSNY